MQYINNNSDFALDIALKAILPDGAELATAPPNCDFTLTFGTRYDEAKYEVGRYNGEPRGYTVNADGSLHVIFDAHGLGLGRLGCMLTYGIPDSSYPDGVATVATSYELDVELIGWGADGQQSGTVTLATEAAAVSAAQQAQAAAEQAAGKATSAVDTANEAKTIAQKAEQSAEMAVAVSKDSEAHAEASRQAAEQSAQQATQSAEAAQRSATAAEQCEAHAEASRQAAEASRQAAEQSAQQATQSAEAAQRSATAAEQSATQATQAAEDADASRQAAETAASQATTSAEMATSAVDKANLAIEDATTAKEAAETATADAIAATEAAKSATAQIPDFAKLIPSALAVEAPRRITLGNLVAQYVVARLEPEDTLPNVLFLSDGKAVAVDQTGRLTVIGEGESVVQVVPTMHTSIAKSVRISVERPTLRLYDTRTKLRLTQSGGLLLN